MHWFDYVMSRCPRHSDYDDHDDPVVYRDGRRGDFWKGVHLSRSSSFIVVFYRRYYYRRHCRSVRQSTS